MPSVLEPSCGPSSEKCSAKCLFISAGCSLGPFLVDWGGAYVAFGSDRTIYLLTPGDGNNFAKIVSSNIIHKSRVTCVRWMNYQCEATNYLLSASQDGSFFCSSIDRDQHLLIEKELKQLESHVSCLAGVWDQEHKGCYIVGCGDRGALHFWRDFQLLQPMYFPSDPAICCDVCLTEAGVLVASGHTDFCVRIHRLTENGQNFENLAVLDACQDWISDLRFSPLSVASEYFYLAGAVRDQSVRIWKINKSKMNDDSKEKFAVQKTILFQWADANWSVSTDTILRTHTDAVTGVSWNPKRSHQLISCSMDKSVIVWTYNKTRDIWEDEAVLGLLGGVDVGFYGCAFGPDGLNVLAHDYLGCIYHWMFDQSQWIPMYMPSGHTSSVQDIAWDSSGSYLLSCSSDMTTRLFGEWKSGDDLHKAIFCEISRPQVHGYEIQCVDFLSSEVFVSGAAEKVLRVFEAPECFRNNTCRRSGAESAELRHTVFSASVPALGLSNRPVYENSNGPSELSDRHANNPPDSVQLAQDTLWPEVQKLYGHGFEIYTVACSNDGKLIASACKASTPEHAKVLLWSRDSNIPQCQLAGHRLTVTRIAFSPDDRYLLTVSRDRRWLVYKKGDLSDFDYTILKASGQALNSHSRVIWDCAWANCNECFVTVSRDMKAIVWQVDMPASQDSSVVVTNASEQKFDVAVTAVDTWIGNPIDGFYCAFGFESGEVDLFHWSLERQFQPILHFKQNYAHALTVRRVKFHPLTNTRDDCVKGKVAFCSNDGCVKIYELSLRI